MSYPVQPEMIIVLGVSDITSEASRCLSQKRQFPKHHHKGRSPQICNESRTIKANKGPTPKGFDIIPLGEFQVPTTL